MSLETLSAGGQGHVHEVLLLEDVLEGSGEGHLVVVPLEAVLLRHPGAIGAHSSSLVVQEQEGRRF